MKKFSKKKLDRLKEMLLNEDPRNFHNANKDDTDQLLKAFAESKARLDDKVSIQATYKSTFSVTPVQKQKT